MKNKNGFTLMEIMLAVTIVAFICAISYGIVLHTLENKERAERYKAVATVGLSVVERIRRDLEHLYIGNIADPFAGTDNRTADKIDFVCTSPSFPDENGKRTHLIEVGYQLKENETALGYYLLLRRESRTVEGNPLQGGVLRVLYDKVKSLNFKYYDGTDWYDSWSYKEQKGLPRAVKIELIIGVEQTPSEEEQEIPPEETMQIKDGYFSTIIAMPLSEEHRPQKQEK
ncbi:MAG: GspJ family type II secretion system protein [Planctomycetota bacterium]|nr:GspJ family type II secretion system protein [Planctomycetota bacterium]